MARKRTTRTKTTAQPETKPLYKITKPKTIGQAQYYHALKENTIIFGIGPAGSGKTYLAVASAVESLFTGVTKKIILVRPAVEAGEHLGFLPGDMEEKINPYLRPLLDALHDMVDVKVVNELMAQEIIEIAPLAFMRGRTLNNAVIILDEAQNATSVQLKMFLTRIGFGSKVIITGDPTQNDLPYDKQSGLADAIRRLDHINGVAVSKLEKTDIIRHPIVQEIVMAYES